jgi:hypothetical protein
MREYMRGRSGNGLQTGLKFRGIDGEGGGEQGTRHPGYHAYFLLACGPHRLLPKDGGARITTGQALEFISSLDPNFCYVGYFFDYDVTKILEDLSFEKLGRLMDRSKRTRKDGRGVFPVSYGPYEIDYIPRKEFKVRKAGGKWIVINDVGPFFQTRFVKALEVWGIGSEEDREIIAKGKDMRGNFDFADIEEVGRYNDAEIRCLEELMEKFRDACTAVDIIPAKWQGPGQLAKALMQKNRVPRSKDVPLLNDPDFTELMVFGKNAYYGGRPELAAIGPVNRPVYQWDINSAYPAAMMEVPCLLHGGWSKEEYVGGMDAAKIDADYALVYGTFTRKDIPGDGYTLWNGLPYRRSDGTICYPGNGTGWYWDFEISASIHQNFKAIEAWVYRRSCECKPLAWIEEVYQQRLDLGKDGPGMVLKLAINSVYGISVQSIGKPEYANPVWGSFITAHCRTTIQGFIHSSPLCRMGKCGKDVLMVATDSVATWFKRTDLEESKRLGGWSVETHPRGMFLIQPGLYFGSSGKHAKTRGVPLAAIEDKEQEFRDRFDAMAVSRRLEDGDVMVPQRLFVGIRLAIHRRNTKLLGQWIGYGEDDKRGKVIRFDWTTKRMPYPVLEPTPARSYLETFPIVGSADDVSTPYSKDIGGLLTREKERAELEAMPDYEPMIEPGEMK